MRTTILLLVAAALAFAGCGGDDDGGAGAGGGEGTTVKVGLTSAFSGDIAYYGQDSKKGAELAIERLHEENPDVRFELVTSDDECSPEGGASSYRRLVDVEQVDVILGSACSGATLGGMPVLQQMQVPGMTFGSTNATISEQSGVGGNEYSWRMNIDDSIMGETWTKYIAEEGIGRVAILAANNDFGRGAAELYAELLPKVNIELTATEYYDLSASDVRSQLTKIDRAGAEALITFAEPTDCALFLRQMNELGIELPMYGRGGCTTNEAIDALGDQRELAEGVMEATYWAPTKPQQEFLDAFQEKFGHFPAYNSALAYYGMLTLAEAVEQGGADPQGMQEGLGKVDFETPIGPIRFDDHNQAHPHMFIVTVEKGEPKVLEEIDTETGASI